MENKIAADMVELIRTEQITTAMVGDALGKPMDILAPGVKRMGAPGVHAGPSRMVYCSRDSNWGIHDSLRFVSPGEFLIITSKPPTSMGMIGELISRYAYEVRGVAGIVVCGSVRDVAELQDVPVWAFDECPIGCFNRETRPVSMDERIIATEIVVADEAGMLAVPQKMITEKSLMSLRQIVVKEKIWFYCMRELEWSTFEIVCEKRWERDLSYLPDELREEWEALQ